MTDQKHSFDLTGTKTRLAAHASLAGVAAPEFLLSDAGAPSKEVMDYCDTHQITLDWVYLGAEPMNRGRKSVPTASRDAKHALTPNPIYESDTGGMDPTSKVGRLYSLARMGVAASDSCMNIDLQKSGYQGLFEQMSLIANELFTDIDHLEWKAKVGVYAPRPVSNDVE